MSRIGKLPISIPAGVTVALNNGVVSVKGPKGELSQKVDSSIIVKIEDGHVVLSVDENSPVNYKQKNAFHGLYRALIHNMVVGVSEGYQKVLELVGVGYRVSNQGNLIEFSLGYTHPIFIQLPKEVKVETTRTRPTRWISWPTTTTSSSCTARSSPPPAPRLPRSIRSRCSPSAPATRFWATTSSPICPCPRNRATSTA